MKKPPIITGHLLIRWLERVDGMDISVFRAAAERAGITEPNDDKLVEFMEVYTSIDFDRIRAQLEPMVAKALASGSFGIKFNGLFIPLHRAGRNAAVSVMPCRSKRFQRARNLIGKGRAARQKIEECALARDDEDPHGKELA